MSTLVQKMATTHSSCLDLWMGEYMRVHTRIVVLPIYLDFTPTFAGWVGDADPTFQGLEVVLKKYLQSTWVGKMIFSYVRELISTVCVYSCLCAVFH